MNNEEYLKQKKLVPGTQTYDEFLTVLGSYGDNRWWLSEDARTRAYYQTMDENGPLVVPFTQYVQDLDLLLGREVQIYETRTSNRETLRQEVAAAWTKQVPA